MEKLIVSPGFVKKIEDEQDTQDQAITSNSQAITKLNNNFGTSATRISTNVQSYLNALGDGHHNVAFTYDAPGLPYTSSTDCHVFIWDKNNHNGIVHATNASKMAYVGLLDNGVLTWQELATKNDLNRIESQTDGTDQVFDLSRLPSGACPIFLFTIGYSTAYITAMIYLDSLAQTNISYAVLNKTSNRDISSVAFNPTSKQLTVTINTNPYRQGALIRIQ